MGKIIVLDELTACQIAAGEVVERPASVVKEMAENAIDAGASKISVEIRNGGIKYIGIEDNGCGFAPDDAVIAFDKHATSKIRGPEDLFRIGTLGFRGEALASIAAVSEVELRTKEKNSDCGVYVKFAGGELLEQGECGCKEGSAFTVRNLFYNTPARYKFLKKDNTEAGYVADAVQKLALSHPEISFRLVSDGKSMLFTPGNGDLMSCLHSLFGKQISACVRTVEFAENGIAVSGFAGVQDAFYGNRNRQFFFVNGRYIKNKTISAAVDEAYKTITMKGRYPFMMLCLSVNAASVDVNVHPTKVEVRFADEGAVFHAVYHGIRNALFGETAEKPEKEEALPAAGGENPDVQSAPSQHAPGLGGIAGFAQGGSGKSFKRSMAGDTASAFVSLFETAENLARGGNAPGEPEKDGSPIFASEDGPDGAALQAGKEETATAGGSATWATATQPVDLPQAESLTAEPAGVSPAIGSLSQSAAPAGGATGEKYGDNDIYVSSTVVGQLFDTYILLQYREELVLLDQHAAHERLMYEKIRRSLEEDEAESQALLAPLTVRLSPPEFASFRENSAFFERLGFEIEEFGSNTLAVRSIPMILSGSNIAEFLISGIGLLAAGKEKVDLFSDRAVYTMACKAAIKANRRLRPEEIDALLRDLAAVKNPGTCPHGRPITVRITKYEIERKFHRC